MSKVAIVFWSATGNTETMANCIAEGAGANGTIVPCAEMTPAKLAEFDVVAFGCPAMGAEQLVLGFPNYSVTPCQNKKTCFHLCKAPFGARPVLGAPGGYNHSVPSSSLSWPPLRFSFVTMITWFSY